MTGQSSRSNKPSMPNVMPDTAMVFAAGLGKRMRAYRDDIPKPLVPVHGRSLIDRVLDKLVQAGVERAVINISYKGEMIRRHVTQRRDIELLFSEEDEPLETAGGLIKALPLLGDGPVFVVNSDICWLDGPTPALRRLADAYHRHEQARSMLLVCPTVKAVGYHGAGDFALRADGAFRFRKQQETVPYVYTGIQLMDTGLLDAYRDERPIPRFSLSRLMHEVDDEGWCRTMAALPHDGIWFHVGDADGVHAAEKTLRNAEQVVPLFPQPPKKPKKKSPPVRSTENEGMQ